MEEVPFEDRHVPRVEIDWDRSVWWWYPLTRAIQPAIRMTSLLVSLVALVIAAGGVALGQWLFQPDWDNQLGWFAVNFDIVGDSSGPLVPSILTWFSFIAQEFGSFRTFGLSELGFVSFEIVWLTATFALLGGVLARRAAVELGQRTVAPWGESFQIVFSRWQSYLWTTGMYLVGLFVLLLPALAFGLLTRLGASAGVVAGILLLLSFPLVFGIGRMALSALICFPFAVCAICIERKADAFEGFSRSNAYVFQRPVVGVLCAVTLLLLGLIGEQLVAWTLNLGWWLASGSFVFSGGPDASSNPSLIYGSWLTRTLIAAYWFSFFWSAVAAIYLILRRSVDNCELDNMETIESELEATLPDIPTTSQTASASTGDAMTDGEAMTNGEASDGASDGVKTE